jgi:hypothetical protein
MHQDGNAAFSHHRRTNQISTDSRPTNPDDDYSLSAAVLTWQLNVLDVTPSILTLLRQRSNVAQHPVWI